MEIRGRGPETLNLAEEATRSRTPGAKSLRGQQEAWPICQIGQVGPAYRTSADKMSHVRMPFSDTSEEGGSPGERFQEGKTTKKTLDLTKEKRGKTEGIMNIVEL